MTKNEDEYMCISDIREGMKTINVIFIILQIGRHLCDHVRLFLDSRITTKEHDTVTTALISDATGSINISLWNEMGIAIKAGDICRLIKGYAAFFKNCLILYTGRKEGRVTKISEFCMVFSEQPNLSHNATYAQICGNGPNYRRDVNERNLHQKENDGDSSGGFGRYEEVVLDANNCFSHLDVPQFVNKTGMSKAETHYHLKRVASNFGGNVRQNYNENFPPMPHPHSKVNSVNTRFNFNRPNMSRMNPPMGNMGSMGMRNSMFGYPYRNKPPVPFTKHGNLNKRNLSPHFIQSNNTNQTTRY
ncbi:Nucleic acid-binding protein 1 [Intoshia linei]|uniref:Nucleic acid-binding protein 1 n=1 Tax=Intoshia linei TaxID=1819745 RepID=A0A177B486_9BILA|nr:Nucleic acid-binding protein 1 [Intoshia linei]